MNTWDRQPYLTRNGVVDGFTREQKLGIEGVSIVKARSHFMHNFIIAGGGSSYTIDHDDGESAEASVQTSLATRGLASEFSRVIGFGEETTMLCQFQII